MNYLPFEKYLHILFACKEIPDLYVCCPTRQLFIDNNMVNAYAWRFIVNIIFISDTLFVLI